MADIISVDFTRKVAPPRRAVRSKGLGVVITAPGMNVGYGILGGNVGVAIEAEMLVHPAFSLNLYGQQSRAERGIVLPEEVGSEPPPAA